MGEVGRCSSGGQESSLPDVHICLIQARELVLLPQHQCVLFVGVRLTEGVKYLDIQGLLWKVIPPPSSQSEVLP